MPKKGYIYIPEPRISRVEQLATQQGLKPPAFVIRVLAMYERDPAAFEKLFHQLAPNTARPAAPQR